MSDLLNQTTNNTQASDLLLAVAYLHFIFIIVPTIVLGIIIIVVIWKEKKRTGLTPIFILYLAMVIFSIAAVLMNGLLWNISLITGIPFLGVCETYPVFQIYITIYYSFHTFVASNVGAAAIFQFLVLRYGKKVSSKWVYIALLFLIITSIGITSVCFSMRGSSTIRGSNCKFAYTLDGITSFALWVVFSFTIPLVLTIVFSVLTCYKVKNAAIQSLNDERSLVTSIVQINVFNILLYITFRLGSILLLFGSLLFTEHASVITVITRSINDASYPATLISILVVHKGMRRMAAKLLCARILRRRSTDTQMAMTRSREAAKSGTTFDAPNDRLPN